MSTNDNTRLAVRKRELQWTGGRSPYDSVRELLADLVALSPLTLRAICAETGVLHSNICHWLRGASAVSPAKISNVLKFLNATESGPIEGHVHNFIVRGELDPLRRLMRFMGVPFDLVRLEPLERSYARGRLRLSQEAYACRHGNWRFLVCRAVGSETVITPRSVPGLRWLGNGVETVTVDVTQSLVDRISENGLMSRDSFDAIVGLKPEKSWSDAIAAAANLGLSPADVIRLMEHL